MKIFIVLSVLAVASASPIAQDDSVLRLFLGNIVHCVNSDIWLCVKEQALKATVRLNAARQFKLAEGVTIINSGPRDAKSLELSADPAERTKEVTAQLWKSSSELLNNSELEINFDAGVGTDEESRAIDNAVEEGRGKKKEVKKKLKILIPLLLLAKAKAVLIVVASLVVIAISLAKLALLAKLAFIAKAIAILKILLHKKHHHEEEHWIPHHEHHEHVEDHGHGWEGAGWSRSRNEANNLAYAGYAQ